MASREMRRIGALALGACALGALAGCHGILVPVMLVSAAAPVMTEGGLLLPNGPTVTVENESDVPLEMRLWVAKVDYLEPTGFRDQRTSDAMVRTVEPGTVRKVNGGESNWPTGQHDGVVWVRFAYQDQIRWYEFARPGPYRVIMRRADVEGFGPGPIEFVPTSGQAMTPLPESAWIEHRDGDYPADAPAAPVIQDLGLDPSTSSD